MNRSKYARPAGIRKIPHNLNRPAGKQLQAKWDRARGEGRIDVSTTYREFLTRFEQIKP